MPPRNSNRDSSIQVSPEDTFCTITLEGEPEITELIWSAIQDVAPIRLKIGRSTSLQESRTPGLVGFRYLSLVYHRNELPEG